MIAEGLVIFACLNSTGCSDTAKAYYEQYPEVKEIVVYNERRIRKTVGPFVMEVVAPFLYAAAGGTGTVKVSNHFSLQESSKEIRLTYGLDF